MNFLAHCLIADRASDREADPALVAGGFLGDFIKGRIPEAMPERLARGVRLHRRIDAYSNTQPDIRASCRRFPPELKRIAPILVDILCDHLLTRRWETYHPDSLTCFTAGTYEQVAEHGVWLPEHGHRFLRYARERDLFARYGDWTVTTGAMHSITRRLGATELNAAIERCVPPLLEDLAADFDRYFPDILEHARLWVAADDDGRRSAGIRS